MGTKLWLVLILCTLGLSNEVFPFNDIYDNKYISKQECELKQHAVWVETSWVEKGFFSDTKKEAKACIRYFPSSNAETSKTAVLFLSGDTGTTKYDNYVKYADYNSQVKWAEDNAKKYGVAVIVVGRPGLYGSSGMSHRDRRLPIETYLVNASFTKIKEKLNYERISIAGQSGGGGLVGAVLTLGRDDIDCAVIASGVPNVKTWTRDNYPNSYMKGEDCDKHSLSEVYDPIEYVKNIVKDKNRRTFVMGDIEDRLASFNAQKEFFNKLVEIKEDATLIHAEAGGTDRHSLSVSSIRVASMCMLKKSNEEIKDKLTKK